MIAGSKPLLLYIFKVAMSSRRVQRAAEAVRGVVGMAILADLNDPRVQDVTVTYVEVSSDLRYAKVHVSVMGDETKQNLCIRGLRSSAGFLQAKLNERVDMQYTPKLEFVLDHGVKKSIEISKILRQVLPNEDSADLEDEEVGETDDAGCGND